MKLGDRSGRALVLATALIVTSAGLAGCSRKPRPRRHAERETPAAALPTPDNTPIDVLRTPSGLVLKLDEPTPLPGKDVTPAPSPSPAGPR
ncbi:MAG: hypothetical protein LC796_03915 [Acidobacteria bacterium]|nr:hypothetical protein [Acidobacteriota bacterium]MCA1610198.1 hypothetical protein [Acidobacteriota bacterium]